MRVFLIGASGQVGHELRLCLRGTELTAPARSELDLGDLAALREALAAARPQVIVNSAAYTDVDGAEKNREAALRLNRDAVALLGEYARDTRTALIHYSTDFVFDGTKGTPYVEDDATNPLSVYGASKLAGENALRELDAPALVLRTAWVYSLRRKSFVSAILRFAREKSELKIVDDQVGNPTYCADLAEATARLIDKFAPDPYAACDSRRGVYHLAGGGSVDRFRFARRILELDPNRDQQQARVLIPVASSEFVTPAQRPLFAPLDCGKIERELGLRLPAWEDALSRALNRGS